MWYLKPLSEAAQHFAHHLKPGGVMIIEPWFTKATYVTGSPHMSVYQSADIKIARQSVSKIRGHLSIMEMNYLIAERDRKVRHFVDRHELGLFEPEKFLQFMRAANLRSKHLTECLMKNRGLYIGVKL